MKIVRLSFVVAAFGVISAHATTLYNNDLPTNSMAMASRPDAGGKTEIEAADDFILASESIVTGGSFTGLLTGATPVIGTVTVEIYRVFPLDSTSPPDGKAPTRANSPSDVEFVGRSTATLDLNFSTSTLAASFSSLKSVLNGINPFPNQTTGGETGVTGAETQFLFTLTTPIDLPADHYFFIPQVEVTGGEFYWLSANRPIVGPGTPIIPDLQAWIRNTPLDPDWLRVGTDIVGGTTPPTFNAAFSLQGTATPEPSGIVLLVTGLSLIGWRQWRTRQRN